MFRLIFLLFFISSPVSLLTAQKVQWASELIGVSSEFSKVPAPQYRGNQALGQPSMLPDFGQSPSAWAPEKEYRESPEYLHVAFEQPMQVVQIVINQPSNPGAIYEIYLYDTEGRKFRVYRQAPNPQMPKDKGGRLFRHFIEPTPYQVKSLRVELLTDKVPGYNLIDAIGISNDSTPIEINIELIVGAEDLGDPENIGDGVNSTGSELAPIIAADGKTLFFTRQNHPQNIGNPKTQDIWYAKADSSGIFGQALNLGSPINDEHSNGAGGISPDGQTLLIMGHYKPNSRPEKGISFTQQIDADNWAYPQAIEVKDFYNNNRHAEYAMAADGKALLLAIERQDGQGGKDIYVSFLQNDGTYSEPLNLGADINTATNEISPFLAADGKTLYFSSSGFPGYGGTDMFVSQRLDDSWTSWSRPKNLGPKLNSPKFDAYYSIPASGDYAYYSSYGSGYGESDIFRVKLPQSAKPQPVVLIYGRVLNAKTKEPLGAKIKYESLANGKELGIARSNAKSGEYRIVLPNGDIYGFLAQLEGFVSVSENIDVGKIKEYQEIEVDLLLSPIEKEAVIRLNNLFFDFNKFNLSPEAKPELDRIVALMNKYPQMNIEIGGHTDNIGTDATNITLSNNRAKSVVDYLTQNGIDATRLQAKGYGKANPAADNSTEKGRALNRRIEMKILKVD